MEGRERKTTKMEGRETKAQIVEEGFGKTSF